MGIGRGTMAIINTLEQERERTMTWPFNVELPPDSSWKWVREPGTEDGLKERLRRENLSIKKEAHHFIDQIFALKTTLETERQARTHQMVIWRRAIQDAHADVQRLEGHIEASRTKILALTDTISQKDDQIDAWRTGAHEASQLLRRKDQIIKELHIEINEKDRFIKLQAAKITDLEEEVQAFKNRPEERRKRIVSQVPQDPSCIDPTD